MKTLIIAILFLPLLSLAQVKIMHPNPNKGNFSVLAADDFSFSLSRAAHTSAGLYQNGKLVTTLWSDVAMQAGINKLPIKFRGKDDFGNALPSGNYDLIIQDYNINSAWQGVVGNTSSALSGNTVHLGYDFIQDIDVCGNEASVATGYSEFSSSEYAYSLNTPQVKIPLAAERVTNPISLQSFSDGTYTYYAGFTNNIPNQCFVHAYKVSDRTPVNFTYGTNVTMHAGGVTVSAIAYYAGSKYPTGLSGQRNGNCLFVSVADSNIVMVLNKTTGQKLQTLSFNAPGKIKVDSTDNALWMIYSPSGSQTVEKFTINGDGTLTSTGLQLTGFSDAAGLDVNSNLVAVCDRGINVQQVKFYNSTTGALQYTRGQAGGYANSPTVYPDKFYWRDNNQVFPCSIAFVNDGSYWLLDYGNNRVEHFNAAGSYIENIGYIGRFYDLTTDYNKDTCLYISYKQYAIDASKPFAQSWKLINNWTFNAPYLTAGANTIRISRVATLSNGKTYAILQRPAGLFYDLYEFTSSGLSVVKYMGTNPLLMLADGSYVVYNVLSNPMRFQVVKYQMSGFDGNNQPVYASTGTLLGTTGAIGTYDTYPSVLLRGQGITTSDSSLLFFDNLPITNNLHKGYHLGFVKVGTAEWLHQTYKANFSSYYGDFPPINTFEVGNGTNSNNGNCVLISGNLVVTGQHCEGWKGTQVNKWSLYTSKGLALAQWGYAQPVGITLAANNVAPIGMAGNAFAASFVKLDSKYRLYHNDESFHGGAPVWDITGANDINTQSIPVVVSNITYAGIYSSKTGIDLLAEVPFNTTLPNNGKFIRSASDSIDKSAFTSLIQYNPLNTTTPNNDLAVYYNSTNPFSVTMPVSTAPLSALTNWKIELGLNINYGAANYDSLDGNSKRANPIYFELLDKDGKVLLQLQRIAERYYTAGSTSYNYIYANGTRVYKAAGYNNLYPVTSITIQYAAGAMTVQCDSGTVYTIPALDATAALNSLYAMRINGVNVSGLTGLTAKEIHLQKAILYYNF